MDPRERCEDRKHKKPAAAKRGAQWKPAPYSHIQETKWTNKGKFEARYFELIYCSISVYTCKTPASGHGPRLQERLEVAVKSE